MANPRKPEASARDASVCMPPHHCARDIKYSHGRLFCVPFLAQILGRLTVSRRLGKQELLSPRSVPTGRGWVPGVEPAEIEMAAHLQFGRWLLWEHPHSVRSIEPTERLRRKLLEATAIVGSELPHMPESPSIRHISHTRFPRVCNPQLATYFT